MIPFQRKQCFSFHTRPMSILSWIPKIRNRSEPRLFQEQYRRFSDYRRVRIGNVEIPLGGKHGRNQKQDRRLVPSLYLSNGHQSDILEENAAGTILSPSSPSIVRHLQWMMAKDSMKQDMLLVGPPGAGEVFRRRLALAYAELTEQPIEILSISGDLTESDLKQRREIVQKTTTNTSNPTTEIEFVDQAPVRAAKHGRLLLLDGIEKAERNVLPTLNNLLENREMHLEDGTMLLPSRRLQELESENNQDWSASSSFLKPVHPDFRVIALGVPTPPFLGRSLDPPLRSRFQIRRIDNPSSEELYEQILQHVDATQKDIIDQEGDVVALAKSCAIFAGAMENSGNYFPSNRLHSMHNLMGQFPLEDHTTILERALPILDSESIDKENAAFGDVSSLFQHSSKVMSSEKKDDCLSNYTIKSVDASLEDNTRVEIELQPEPNIANSDECLSFHALKGNRSIRVNPSPGIVHTPSFRKALTTMVQEHSVGNDFLLVSPKGEGKTTLVREFASLLGYETHLYAMNTEMTSQHLLQRRSTDPSSGETRWEDSPLVRAARRGDICVLDGVEKLRPDVLSSIQSLMVDRDIQLPDGRRALRHDRIFVENSTEDDSYIKVHPSFRVIALASLPRGDDGNRWMTPSLVAMFSTISLPSLKEECLREIMKQYTSSDAASSAVNKILELREELSDSIAEECGVAPLSTRNMVRTVRRMGTQTDLHHVLSSIFLFDLLPSRQRGALEEIFGRIGISTSQRNEDVEIESKIEVSESEAKVGSLVFQRGNVTRPEMVPSPQAFDIPAHTRIIKELLHDWQSGERSFLLLGNQGVGKNKIVDRICEIANWEREYIQLHRDSTIGQLTLTPQLEDGRIVWNDSPLIRAVRDGCVLLIDEADKAPVEVVSVLKGLVEDGELLLADGRRISRHGDDLNDNIIPIHPNFSLWVLANRPGFPFLGNDFFREIGDCFDTRVVNNPDLKSEIQLLASYAPSLDQEVIRALASSFSDLRSLSDDGDLTYPYSTREAIAVVKHLQKYPQDGLDAALQNVLDFDSYDTQTYMILGEAFERHGIAISDSLAWKEELSKYKSALSGDLRGDLSIEYLGSNRGEDGESASPPVNSSPKFGKWDDNNEIHVGGNQWAGGTGGSDTAGLGGRGGPYRLDRGHRVHQVSDKAKEEVSEDTKRAAKQMAKKALEEKLRKIGMGEEEYDMYKDFSANIQKDVSKLKSILSTLEFRTQERGWLKRQSYGEIDDSKIVDGITGDKYIYKRRGNIDEESFSKEKYIRFVMDISGSMYRFNGYDQRLIRCLEAALLVMESFPSDTLGETKKFDYSMVGHSGDSPCIPFVDWASAPKNEKDRLQLLQTMLAHSQYCMSGDYTLEAMRRAIEEVANKVGDATIGDNEKNGTVICLSDANLARYGIDPRRIGKLIESGAKKGVKVYIVFIASFGEEAKAITRALPAGSGYICMETSELPKAVREILSSGVLK